MESEGQGIHFPPGILLPTALPSVPASSCSAALLQRDDRLSLYTQECTCQQLPSTRRGEFHSPIVLTVQTEWPEQSPPSAEGLPFGLCPRGIPFRAFAPCCRLLSLAAGCLLGHCRSWGEWGELPLVPPSKWAPPQRSCPPSRGSRSACVFGCFCAREFPSRPPQTEGFHGLDPGGFLPPSTAVLMCLGAFVQ